MLFLQPSVRTMAFAGGLIAVSFAAHANKITLTQPENFKNGNEVQALTNPNAASIGQGSWQADSSLTGSDGKQHLIYLQGGSDGPYDGGPNSYSAAGKNAQLLFSDGSGSGDNVTINDLDSISFDTDTEGRPDWFINLFTRTEQGAYDGPQFDLVAEYASNSSSNGGFTTHAFNANGGAVYQNSDLSDGGDLTTYSQSELKADFGDRSLLYVALGTGTNYDGLDGSVDNVRFDYTKDGESFSRTIDLEANAATTDVPASSMLPLAGLMLALMGLFGLRRRTLG